MAENPVVRLNELYKQFCAGSFDRREFMLRAGGLGLSAASLSIFFRAIPTSAQDASPVSGGEVINSITREEFKAELAEAFPMEEPGSTGGTLILGEIQSSDLTTTNLMISNNSPTNPVMNLVQETLVNSHPARGDYVPGLADRWEISADGLTYTFFLNQQAAWHDGTAFTADDVIFSCDAQANPETQSSYTGSFTGSVASWTKVDNFTVQMVATDVFAPIVFFGNSYVPIIPKHIWESVPVGEWASDGGSTGADPTRVVGTGPFKFQERIEGDRTTFVRNENYYDGPPTIDTFIFQVRTDDTAAVEALRAGEIDLYEGVPPADTQSIMDEDSLDVAIYDTLSFGFYGYNLDPEKTTLFQDVKVRQALLHAIDRQSVVDNILFGYGEVANGSQPTLSLAYAPDQITNVYNFDVDKAKALLAEAGWADADGDGILEKDGTPLAFEVMYGGGSATSDQTVAYFQEAWREVGVDATPASVDFDTVLVPAITQNFNYEMCFLGFNWDVTADQSAMFSSNMYQQGFNLMRYSNPEVDRLNDEANRELDPERRRELLVESANLVNNDLPLAVLWFRQDRTAYNVRVHNYHPNAYAGYLWSLPFVWVES